MEHVHSILILKKNNKYYTYYDNRWGMELFPNIKGNSIDDIKEYLKTNLNIDNCNVELLLDDKVKENNSDIINYIKEYYGE